MTDWGALRHCSGTAEQIPALLAAAERSGNDSGPEWDDVWGLLCHQGTVYTASYAALPYLAEIAERHSPAHWNAALHLAASIVASNDGPDDSEDPRLNHSTALALLRDLAERDLALADGDIEFAYGLQALMAFENGGVWQRNLEQLANGEVSLDCPSCQEYLLMDLAGPEFRFISFSDATLQGSWVQPIEPDPGTVEDRILSLTGIHHRPEVALRLRHLFGSTSCPRCRAPISVPAALS